MGQNIHFFENFHKYLLILFSKDEFSYSNMLKSFVHKNKHNLPNKFENWLFDLLVPAIEWTFDYINQNINICFSFLINNIISHIAHAKTETQFLVGLWYGLHPFIISTKRNEFVSKVSRLSNKKIFEIFNSLQFF